MSALPYVKVFKSLYLPNLWMDLVDTWHDGRYCSKVSCCTILTPPQCQGHGLRNFMLKFLVKDFKSLNLLAYSIELVDTLPGVRYCYKFYSASSDLKVKVTDRNFIVKFLKVYIYWRIEWIQLILCLMLGSGLKFYTQWTWGQGHGLRNFMLMFLVKTFKRLYLRLH